MQHGVVPRAGAVWRDSNQADAFEDGQRWKKGETGIPLIDANMREVILIFEWNYKIYYEKNI